MSVQHTVVFRLRPEVEESDFLDAARAALIPIPGVEGFTIQRQIGRKSDLTLQFSMRFADRAVYDAYNTHPAHVAFVGSRWDADVDAFQEYDFTDL